MQNALHKAMALADGELRASEVPDLVHEMARSPALLRAFQVYLSMGRNRIAKAYSAKREQPVPQWLIDTVMTAPMPGPATSSRPTRAIWGSLLGWLKDKYSMPGWSLAASPAVAAILAVALVWLLAPSATHGEGLLTAQLQRAIETTGNGEEAPIVALRPVLTFLSKDKTYCRQFEVRSGAERTAAVACRSTTGEWQVLKRSAPYPIGTLPAGSNREEVDRFTAGLMSGQPLAKDQVKSLTVNGWQNGAAGTPARKP